MALETGAERKLAIAGHTIHYEAITIRGAIRNIPGF
jgi:hypothetical protein